MKKILSALAAAALALGACAEIEEAKTDSVQLSTNEVAAEPEGGVYDIVVTSDSDWRVSGLCDWARPLNESGKSGETKRLKWTRAIRKRSYRPNSRYSPALQSRP